MPKNITRRIIKYSKIKFIELVRLLFVMHIAKHNYNLKFFWCKTFKSNNSD